MTKFLLRILNEHLLSKTSKDTLFVMSGVAFNKIFSLISFMILTRALGPDMYGLYAIAMSVLMTALEITDLGINASMIRYGAEYSKNKDQQKLISLISITLRSRIIIAVVLFVLGVLFSNQIAEYIYNNNAVYPFLIVAFSGVFFVILFSVVSAIFISLQQFKYLLIINLIYGVSNFIGVLILFLSDLLTAMNAFVISILSFLLAFLFAIKKIPKGFLRSNISDPGISKKLYNFGKWMFIWSLGYIIYNQINFIMLSRYTDLSMVGYYSSAFRIATLAQILSGAYSTVINPKISSINNTFDRLRELRHSFYFILAINILIGIVALVTPKVIIILAGAQFFPSIPITQWLLLWMGLTVFTLPFHAYIYAIERTDFFALSIIIACLLTIFLNFYFIPNHGPVGAAISMVLSQIPASLAFIIPAIQDIKKTTNSPNGLG